MKPAAQPPVNVWMKRAIKIESLLLIDGIDSLRQNILNSSNPNFQLNGASSNLSTMEAGCTFIH